MVAANMAASIPALMSVLFIGPLSDRYGRKLLLTINIIMLCVNNGLGIAVIHFRLKLYYLLVAAFGFGLGGNLTGFLMTLMSYISDVTPQDRRPFRIGRYLIGQKFVGQKCRNFSLVSKILSDEEFCPSKILSNILAQRSGKNRTKLSKFRLGV